MPEIETQGISEDYSRATGDFDSISRGFIADEDLIQILQKVSQLSTPEGDELCPPSINVKLKQDDFWSNFFGDNGVLRCTDSKQEEMTPKDAFKIITGAMSIKDFDKVNGFGKSKNSLAPVIFILILIAIAVFLFSNTDIFANI